MDIGKGYIGDIISFYAYNVSNNVEYIGKAPAGSATSSDTWQITKLTYDISENLTQIQYASGNKKFDKVWDNRAGYTYS
uniref:Uncharacterized protein n=1 Tax=viral metagenome TaxID=1070528 RepID=A0A6M3L8X5_9ZZZZ